MNTIKLILFIFFASTLQIASGQIYSTNLSRETDDRKMSENLFVAVKKIHENLSRVSSVRTMINYSNSNELQLATVTQGASEKSMVISFGLIDSYKSDRDALAFIIAHEMAGIAMGIKDSSTSSSYSTKSVLKSTASNLAENVISSKLFGGNSFFRQNIPISQIAASSTDSAINASSSKDNTITADKMAYQWLINANYDPFAAQRAVNKMINLYQNNKSSNFFNNKWLDPERLNYLKQFEPTDRSNAPKLISLDSQI